MCDECDDDRNIRGCKDPHACASKAATRLKEINPGWVPMPAGTAQPAVTLVDGNEPNGRFKPLKAITSLSEGIHAMTHRVGEPKEHPTPQVRRRAQIAPVPEKPQPEPSLWEKVVVA
ncbi:hypothetical protein B0H10DRAFT_2233968 [Mycena sp. CBHHK59/15]|nr:hypothetical protein B0H10DRAFT_2233968 [Mycena sp. CBHHK59/15]